jgi:biopolymer transport protein ExbB/TolQ
VDIIKFLQLGGSVMIPLIIISIITVTLIIDLAWVNAKSHNSLNTLKHNENPEPSFDPVSKVVNSDKPIDEKMEIFTFEIQKIERKTSLLSIIASIAPLLGLLGTVMGMIKIFNIVSTQRPTNPLESLSGGISEALFSTAGGLVVAIIAGFAHYFLISSLDSIGDKTTIYLNKQK